MIGALMKTANGSFLEYTRNVKQIRLHQTARLKREPSPGPPKYAFAITACVNLVRL